MAGGRAAGDRVKALLLVTGLASLLSACTTTNDGYVPIADVPPTNVLTVDIDTGAQIALDPGKGVGLAVQYLGSGTWTIETACDTTQSGFTCAWDLVASLQSPFQLSSTDAPALRIDPGAYRIVLPAQSASDLVTLSSPPGEALELDVVFDQVHDASMVSWTTGGAIKTGAPSNPVNFLPTTP